MAGWPILSLATVGGKAVIVRLLRHVLAPAYLYAINPGPLGRWGVVYAVWIALLLVGLVVAVRLRRRVRAVATATAAMCGVGVLFLGLRLLASCPAVAAWSGKLDEQARFLLLEVWTARVWPIAATVGALTIPVIGLLRHVRLPLIVRRHLGALAMRLDVDVPSLPGWQVVVLGTMHLCGLAWLWYSGGQPWWWAVPSLALLLALSTLATPHRLRPETLVAMFPAYVASLVGDVLGRVGIDVREYQAFPFPDPWSPWFDVSAMAWGGFAYSLITQVWLAARGWRANVRRWVMIVLPGVAILAWLGGVAVVHRTHGVTASDPYCYAQMTVDLAESGSPLHDFPLAGLARELGLPTWPTVHIGYHPPTHGDRAPTMWPIGWPVLMLPFYKVGGLDGLYWSAPLMGALALAATWLLVNEVLRGEPGVSRYAVAALTCALVATSPEGAERILVPMADAAAQLFTTLTLWLLLRSWRSRSLRYDLLAGLCFGMAYWIRHPQLPLGVAAVASLLDTRRSLRRRLGGLAAFGVAAALVAWPDLVYHRTVFGGWLHPESSEGFLISWRNVWPSLVGVLRQGILRREELGFVIGFVLYGGWLLWRRHSYPASLLAAGVGGVLILHFAYAALRPRDLIAVLPPLYLCAAYGVAGVWRWLRRRRLLPAAVGILCCLVLLSARSYRTFSMPWRGDVITFGHVSADQYRAFLRLRELVPGNGVVGCMLNGGAVELHAGREAVHPAPWTQEELCAWVEGLRARGRPFYILDDGEEMAGVMASLGRCYRLVLVGKLNLPYFAIGGGNLPRPAFLYRVE